MEKDDVHVICPECDGSGVDYETRGTEDCLTCKGNGYIYGRDTPIHG